MNPMFTFMDIVTIFGIAVALFGCCFGLYKFSASSTHTRIKDLKTDLEAEIQYIKDNYVQKETFNQINGKIDDLRQQQKDMVGRVDSILKWLIDTNVARSASSTSDQKRRFEDHNL